MWCVNIKKVADFNLSVKVNTIVFDSCLSFLFFALLEILKNLLFLLSSLRLNPPLDPYFCWFVNLSVCVCVFTHLIPHLICH